MLILAGIGFYSCDDITKGYLETGEAGYVTDTLRIALAPDSRDSIPYQSEKIQGVIGTFPIYYELAALRDDSGREVEAVIASQVEVVLTGVFRIARDHTIPVKTLPRWPLIAIAVFLFVSFCVLLDFDYCFTIIFFA